MAQTIASPSYPHLHTSPRLPPELLRLVASSLISDHAFASVASLGRTSRRQYAMVTPMLFDTVFLSAYAARKLFGLFNLVNDDERHLMLQARLPDESKIDRLSLPFPLRLRWYLSLIQRILLGVDLGHPPGLGPALEWQKAYNLLFPGSLFLPAVQCISLVIPALNRLAGVWDLSQVSPVLEFLASSSRGQNLCIRHADLGDEHFDNVIRALSTSADIPPAQIWGADQGWSMEKTREWLIMDYRMYTHVMEIVMETLGKGMKSITLHFAHHHSIILPSAPKFRISFLPRPPWYQAGKSKAKWKLNQGEAPGSGAGASEHREIFCDKHSTTLAWRTEQVVQALRNSNFTLDSKPRHIELIGAFDGLLPSGEGWEGDVDREFFWAEVQKAVDKIQAERRQMWKMSLVDSKQWLETLSPPFMGDLRVTVVEGSAIASTPGCDVCDVYL